MMASAAVDLHLDLVRTASQWKTLVPALDIGRVSRLRRKLLEDGGPVNGLGVAAGNINFIEESLQSPVNIDSMSENRFFGEVERWQEIERDAKKTLSYVLSLSKNGTNNVLGDFAKLWRKFAVVVNQEIYLYIHHCR